MCISLFIEVLRYETHMYPSTTNSAQNVAYGVYVCLCVKERESTYTKHNIIHFRERKRQHFYTQQNIIHSEK